MTLKIENYVIVEASSGMIVMAGIDKEDAWGLIYDYFGDVNENAYSGFPATRKAAEMADEPDQDWRIDGGIICTVEEFDEENQPYDEGGHRADDENDLIWLEERA